jgi:putative salt-induced outer membrane protein YdiY
MKRFRVMIVMIVGWSLTIGSVSFADGQTSESQAVTPVLDVVTLKDGSVIRGEVMEMTGGVLHIKNAMANDTIKVKWTEVSKLTISHPIPFHLKEGTVLIGTVEESDPGTMKVKAGPTGSVMTVPMDTVKQVNPVIQPPVVYTGSINAGYSQSAGNAHLKNVSVIGDFVARSEQLRLTMLGRYVYGDNNGSLITRNARGSIKLDFFITKRFFWFASAYFEHDFFQDLKLRTAIASGPGYQWIEQGDYGGIFTGMTLYTEAGPAYFNEDFRTAPDQASFRGRVSTKWNWPFFDDRVTIYHYHEIFPSFQNFSDFFFTMDNGIRLKIFEGLASGFQVTTRYLNQPPPGVVNTDNLYLLTLGYSFDTTRKR